MIWKLVKFYFKMVAIRKKKLRLDRLDVMLESILVLSVEHVLNLKTIMHKIVFLFQSIIVLLG